MKKIKRILLIIPTNTSGGAERVMCQLANEFSKKDIKVCLANFDSNSEFYPISEKVKWVKMGLEFKRKQKWRKIAEAPAIEIKRFLFIRKLIKEFKPDIVLPFLEMAELLTIPNCLTMNVPFCVSIRNDYSSYFYYMKLLSKYTYQKARLVVCQTEAVRQMLLKTVKCNTAVIENPLDEASYSSKPYTGSRRKVIINVGRLTPQKNQKMLIDVFHTISNEFPEYKLHIFGDGELRNELQLQIDQYGLQSRIVLKGIVPNALKENNDAALFVMSSDFEGFPNTLAEAMANGIPVISTDFNTNAARTLLKNGACGSLVPVGNENVLKTTIQHALLDWELTEQKAHRGLYVKEQLNAEKIAQVWIDKILEAS